MKVAVISGPGLSNEGKSTFITILGTVFARSQQRRVSIFTSGTSTDYAEIATTKQERSPVQSMNVFKALLSGGQIKGQEVYDYAYRLGPEEVFLFNFINNEEELFDMEDTILSTLRGVNSELVLVEIKGDYRSEFNRRVIKECDAILYVFTPCAHSFKCLREYMETEDNVTLRKSLYVVQKYDANVISEKRLGELVQMKSRRILTVPYSPAIARECLNANVQSVAPSIIAGHSEVVNVRMKLLEVMQALFDAPDFQYIKGIADWHK